MANLSHARHKLHRARTHIDHLKAAEATFFSLADFKLRTQSTNGRWQLLFNSERKPDLDLLVIVGDAISNLRSSLDYAAVACAPLADAMGAAFPFGGTREQFEAAAKRAMQAASPEIVQLVTDFGCYKDGPAHLLWTVNKLRNIDKHRFLIATSNLAGVTLDFTDRNGNVFRGISMAVAHGEEGYFIDSPDILRFTAPPRPLFELILNEPDLVQANAVSFLSDATAALASAIDSIDVHANQPSESLIKVVSAAEGRRRGFI